MSIVAGSLLTRAPVRKKKLCSLWLLRGLRWSNLTSCEDRMSRAHFLKQRYGLKSISKYPVIHLDRVSRSCNCMYNDRGSFPAFNRSSL